MNPGHRCPAGGGFTTSHLALGRRKRNWHSWRRWIRGVKVSEKPTGSVRDSDIPCHSQCHLQLRAISRIGDILIRRSSRRAGREFRRGQPRYSPTRLPAILFGGGFSLSFRIETHTRAAGSGARRLEPQPGPGERRRGRRNRALERGSQQDSKPSARAGNFTLCHGLERATLFSVLELSRRRFSERDQDTRRSNCKAWAYE